MSTLGSRSVARNGKVLAPAFLERRWKPGQSGNPSGLNGQYGEAISLARQAAPDAVRRLVQLMGSDDERVAVVACNAILDRALGKPREPLPASKAPEEMSDQELEDRIVQNLVQGGLSERKAREVVRKRRDTPFSTPAPGKYLVSRE
jgi:hypothetical protein